MNENPAATALGDVRRLLAEKPDGVLETVAAEHGLPLRSVVECLPAAMWTRAGGGDFVEVMGEIAGWGEVTVIAHTRDVILEFRGPLPSGKLAHGFYNLQGGSGLGGHLRAGNCRAIYFVRRPFMGKDSASVQFFNGDGESMLKVFLGRDEEGRLRPDQLERFARLASRLSAPT